VTREDFEQRFSQVLSLSYSLDCYVLSEVYKLPHGPPERSDLYKRTQSITNDSRRVLTPKASRALFLSS